MQLFVLVLLSLLLFSACQTKTNPEPAPAAPAAQPAPAPAPVAPPDPVAKLGEVTPPEPPEIDAEPSENEAEIQFRAAAEFYRQRKYPFAAAAFAEVLQLDRRRDDARFYLAASLLCAGRPEEAVGPLTRLARDNDEAAFLLAKAQIQRKEYRAARQVLAGLETDEARTLLAALNELRREL